METSSSARLSLGGSHGPNCALLRRTRISSSRPSRQFPSRRVCAVASESPTSTRTRPEYVPNKISDPNYVRIFDTTLRDGEQSPGATLTSKEKLEIAKMLAKLRVDIIEAGFPVASPDDFDAVRGIANEVGNGVQADGYVPVICGLSRTKLGDVDRAWEAVRSARLPRVHTFIATSDIHMKQKLRMTPDEVVASAVKAVDRLREQGCEDIEFSPEDAGRSDPEFLYRILGEVIKAGATTLNIPDTTGWNLPHEFGGLISKIMENTPGIENAVVSTHCQNDLGLASANSLAGGMAGARQIECTINGIGERAGNCSLEEVVMAVALRGDNLMGGLWTGITPVFISPTSKMVSDYTGMVVQPHKAIVGANAFQHESGIHQDGMLKSKETYEIMTPESIGLIRDDAAGITMGKHSGRHALKARLLQLGFELEEEKLNEVFRRFKNLADTKKGIVDEDLLALVGDEMNRSAVVWELMDLQVVCGTMGLPTATIRMAGPDGIIRVSTACGVGPVDAAFKAVDSLVRVEAQLVDYDVTSVTEGIEALANTRIVIRPVGTVAMVRNPQGGEYKRSFSGNGADGDIVVSSARAYVSALNKLIGFLSSQRKQQRIAAEEQTEAVKAVAKG
ncbi:hypothetical protein BSKO_11699 [Bryopsis sp. KO-2023]|nr:hypothetical protein BSKO_11699 [Bryopsis sp. KO-2023]